VVLPLQQKWTQPLVRLIRDTKAGEALVSVSKRARLIVRPDLRQFEQGRAYGKQERSRSRSLLQSLQSEARWVMRTPSF